MMFFQKSDRKEYSDLTSVENKLGSVSFGERFSFDLDLSSAGDKYVDVTIPTPPTGYTTSAVIAQCWTYRAYIKGFGGDRCYYYVVSPSSGLTQGVYATPLLYKLS